MVVAVFDTGVDPAAANLRTTTEGKPKLIDIVDCTGSGDVDTSAERVLDDSRSVRGLSGRTLQVWQRGYGKRATIYRQSDGRELIVGSPPTTTIYSKDPGRVEHSQRQGVHWQEAHLPALPKPSCRSPQGVYAAESAVGFLL